MRSSDRYPVCQGADEPYELHLRYCVPLAEQRTREQHEAIDAARGCILGIVIGCAIWVVIAVLIAFAII